MGIDSPKENSPERLLCVSRGGYVSRFLGGVHHPQSMPPRKLV
jgi:hypothetical protein